MLKPYPNEQELKELITEHEQLRKEILHNETVIMQTLTSTLAIVAAVMGIAFSAAVQDLAVKSALFFVAESVAIVAMMQSTDKGRLTYLIASYLRVFTEARLHHLKWETRLVEFRRLAPRKGYGGLVSNHLWIYNFIVVANFILGSWYAIQSSENSIAHYAVIGFLIISLSITVMLSRLAYARYVKYVCKHTETFEPLWKRVRDEESSRERL